MNITLLLVQGRPAGKRMVFPPGEYYFGRGLECHVRPESEWVSRQHCLLRVAPGAAFIRDLGSCNGTLVNGELVTQERRLRSKDLLQIGPLVFEVHAQRAELVPSSAETTDSLLNGKTVQAVAAVATNAAACAEATLATAVAAEELAEPPPTARMPQNR